jgi:hypothetical protein
MVFSSPPIPIVREEPTILFGPEASLQERYDDPEVQGGKLALIAVKQMRAKKPPNGLDRMQTNLLKKIAYNQRIMEAEDEIAGINCDIPHLLSEMSREERVIVCVNGSEEMKRNEEAIAGQLWIQGDRQMTASNRVYDGMANPRDSALLRAAAEAVTWRHALENEGVRKGQRVVIYPKELVQLEEVLSTCDPEIDNEDGHSIAYAMILRESQNFENTPISLSEESARSVEDPLIAEKSFPYSREWS